MRARVAIALVAWLTLAAVGCQLVPPLGAAPMLEPLTSSAPDAPVDPARWEYPTVCYKQWFAPDEVPRTITGGSGRTIAVIGDSLTTQARDLLIARGGFEWHVTSLCGAQVQDYLPGGFLEDTLAEIAALQPEVVVVALGTNDGKSGASLRETAVQLLAALPATVPVAWVLPAMSHDEHDLEVATVRAEISNLPDVTVIDWAPMADTADARLDDGTHLTWSGAGLYASLIAGGTRLLPVPVVD